MEHSVFDYKVIFREPGKPPVEFAYAVSFAGAYLSVPSNVQSIHGSAWVETLPGYTIHSPEGNIIHYFQ